MAKNTVFRVYDNEETMLKVYSRRLGMADERSRRCRPDKERFAARYQNKPNATEITDEGHRVSVTVGIGIIDTMFSSMTAVDIEWLVKNLGHGTRAQQLIATQAMNAAWRDTKGSRRAKKAVKDALISDIGWVKVYYDYQEDVQLKDRPEQAVRAELEEYLGEHPEENAEDAVLKVDLTEDVTIVMRDRVCVDYVKYDHMRYDTTAKQIEDVRWCAQYTRLPVPEVTRNPMYVAFVEDRYGKAEARRLLDDIEGDTVAENGLNEYQYQDVEGLGQDEYGDDLRVTVVEMWDLETGLVTIFPRTRTDIILHQRTNPLMLNNDLEDRNPFKPLVVRDDPENLEGLGDMRIIEPGLQEMDEYRSNMAEHVSRSIPKVVGPARALTAAGKKAFESRVYGEYVALEEGHHFGDIGFPQPAPLQQEVYGVPAVIEKEMKEATGANEVLRGVFPSKRTTATETEYVADAGERRQAERRGMLEEWFLDIGRTMLQLMQFFYKQERMMRFTTDAGQDFVWSWTDEDIAIEADLSVSLTPRESLTRDQRVQRALQIGNLGLALPEFDRAEWLKFTYEEMGLDPADIRRLVKTDEEVKTEQQQQQVAQQLAAAPQAFGNAPAGLAITPKGGGG